MANLVKIAELLKNASDQQLASELNNPNGSAPSYMVLSELQRRKKMRGSLMNQEPQSSVAEDMEQESSRANQMGIGGFQQQMPQQAPQGYAGGGEVDYGGGYETDPSENTFWPSWDEIKKRTGYGRMLPQTQATQAAAPLTPVVPAVPAAVQTQRPAPVAQAPAAGIPSLAPAKPVKSQTPAGNPLMDELRGYRKDLADAYKNQADVYKQQAEDVKNSKDSDVAMALMQAGFGIMGGRSQFAAENIGQGALPAVQQYAATERERQKELQKLATGQGQLGIEQLGAQMKGALGEGELSVNERKAAAAEMQARASMAGVGAARAQANDLRIAALREKALESLGKDPNFQFMNPNQQEAAIQNRMRQLGISVGGGNAAPAQPMIAGTYNPKTGKIE